MGHASKPSGLERQTEPRDALASALDIEEGGRMAAKDGAVRQGSTEQ